MIKGSNELYRIDEFLKVASEFDREFSEEIAEEKKEYLLRTEMSQNKN